MNEAQIYRRAYWKAVTGGLLAAVGLGFVVAIVGGISPRVVMHPLLRIAISYGVMWGVLHAMYARGGGLMGFHVTCTAWVLASAAMIAGFVMIPFLQGFEPSGRPITVDEERAAVIVLSIMFATQSVGCTLAGWVHGG